jgi:hypothetical protein
MSEEQTKTRFEWATEIRTELRKNVASVLSLGKLFVAARDALRHGEFESMFDDLPIDQRTAQMYMSIAEHPVIANPKHVSLFPPSWSTLYVLSRVEPMRLEAALKDGLINPRTQREEARQLFCAPPPVKDWPLAQCDDRLRNVINAELTNAAITDRTQIISLWRQIGDELVRNIDLQDDVQAALDDLEIHDAEPGGYRVFEDEMAAACHAGGPAVVSGFKSTHANWYRALTTKADGATALDREVVEHRLDDIRIGRVPTTRTRSSFNAVLLSIHGLARERKQPGGP